MPFYEYKCDDCGEVFTMLQKRDAAREGHKCPECSGENTKRVLSTFSAHGNTDPVPVSSGGGSCCCGGSCNL